MNRLTRDGTAEPVSRDRILRRVRGQENIYFPCSANHEQDWEPYPVDPYSCYMCDHTYIHTHSPYIHTGTYVHKQTCTVFSSPTDILGCTHIARVYINRVRLPNLLVVSWTPGKMNISLSPFASENLVSRDGFGRPVPRQPAHSPHSG